MTAMQRLLNELNGNSFQELFSNQNYIKEYLESRIKSTYLESEKQQIIEASKYTLEQCDTPVKGSLNDFYESVYNEVTK